MAETKKVRLKESRGNPTDGGIIRAGAVVDLPAFWADKWIAEDVAELVEDSAAPPAREKKNVGKTGKKIS